MRVTGEGDIEQNGPERHGWYTEDEQEGRSYFSDSPEYVPTDPGPDVVEDPARFDRMAVFDLEPEEREMLILGLRDWGGPAYGSDALAVAMGFADMDGLGTEAQILIDAIERKQALSIRDWTRALVATEFAFASSVLGTGPSEWSSINGGRGEHWIGVLEPLQYKLPRDPDALRATSGR